MPRIRYGLVILGLCTIPGLATGGELDEPRRQELAHMLKHDCGSCHGLTLRGGLGPPLTARALKGVPSSALRNTIMNGRPGTPMPPFAGLLTDLDVDWLVSSLLNGGTADD